MSDTRLAKKPTNDFLSYTVSKEEQNLILENLGLVTIEKDPSKGVTPIELKQFAWQSFRLGLDIFNREIFLVPRWNKKLGRNVYTPQISIDGMRLIAERTGQYLGSSEPKYVKTDIEGKAPIISCTVTVKKLIGEHVGEFSATVYLNEYNDANSFLWQSKPLSMLAKVAESHALRKAFPDKLAGVYTSEEYVPDEKPESNQEKIAKAEEEFKKNGPRKKPGVVEIEVVKTGNVEPIVGTGTPEEVYKDIKHPAEPPSSKMTIVDENSEEVEGTVNKDGTFTPRVIEEL